MSRVSSLRIYLERKLNPFFPDAPIWRSTSALGLVHRRPQLDRCKLMTKSRVTSEQGGRPHPPKITASSQRALRLSCCDAKRKDKESFLLK